VATKGGRETQISRTPKLESDWSTRGPKRRKYPSTITFAYGNMSKLDNWF